MVASRKVRSKTPLEILAYCAGMVFVLCCSAWAQSPTITSISPSSVTAGGPSATLTVTGSGFLVNSVVQVNGSNRATTFISSLQVSATLMPSDIALPGTLQITVFTPILGARPGGGTSNPVFLVVATAVSPPILTSIGPGLVTQGVQNLRLTLSGANFRPGATVVISPPLASLNNSNGRTPAADVVVTRVTRINSNLMTAVISLGPRATIGLRGVDVLNIDGTSTAISPNGAPGTTQPMRVEGSTSIGAPVSVLNLALIHPRDGTVVAEGQELNAEAVLGGAGTGTVIGQWVWDGNVVEQFTASILAGQSTAIRTRQSLPTWLLGVHTLQLRMIQPNQIATRPVFVVVNPGDWVLQKLIAPEYGAVFSSDSPPTLLWAPVPGAAKYQVGFSAQPYLSTIEQWFDITDNRWAVPIATWQKLPEGPLYWTVRTVDTPGQSRKPLPMRSIVRVPKGALTASKMALGRTAAGHSLLEWNPVGLKTMYLVTISKDSEGHDPVRRYLTAEPKLDLRAIDGKLTVGSTYFWRVEAIGFDGRLLLSGPTQSFVAEHVSQSTYDPNFGLVQLASLGRPPFLPGIALDLSAEIISRTPPPNSNLQDVQPAISAQFQAAVIPADVSILVDGIDVTPIAQVTDTKVTYAPPMALPSGDHTVNLTVGSEATSWKFTIAGAPAAAAVVPSPVQVAPGTDAEAPPVPILGTMPSPESVTAMRSQASKAATQSTQRRYQAPTMEGQFSSNTQWASGSNPPDSNALSLGERIMYQDGPWTTEVNGSGLLNSVLSPESQRTSRGRFNDYVMQMSYKNGDWGANLRFGILSPQLYTDAQFVTAATPRQGAEVMLTTPAGTFGYFANTNDLALGGGFGVTFHQQLMGASWLAPLPKRWAEFRLMWLSAQDIGAPTTVMFDSQGQPIISPNPVASQSKGDVYGGMLVVHLRPTWNWTSEYAWSKENPDVAASSQFLSGKAWRTGITGQQKNTTVSVAYRDVGPNFGNPANPSLTQASSPDLRGVDSAVTQKTAAGTIGVGYTFLQNNVHPTTSPELSFNSVNETWTKPFGVKTNLALQATESFTGTGTIPSSLQGLPPDQQGAQDQRDISTNITVSRQIGMLTMSLGGVRDWNRNNISPIADTITSAITIGTNWVNRGFFQLNSQVNLNWVAADKLTIGDTRNITAYIQPAFIWNKRGLQVSPLISLSQGRTLLATGTLTNDTLTGQYGGRLAWTPPGVMKFNTFSVQGSYNQNRNNVINLDQRGTQLFVLWTATWGHKSAL